MPPRPSNGFCRVWWRVGVFLLLTPLFVLPLAAQSVADDSGRPVLVIPRVDHPPQLEDFLGMQAANGWEGKLLKVENFIQRAPTDGAPAGQRTVAYLGYDDVNFYVIWVAFDTEPEKVRARMGRRDTQQADDIIHILIDTQNDQLRGYSFATNALGNQWDSIWTEGRRFDDAFDTVWDARGQRTDQGFVVWMAIPFKSLRFPPTDEQTWGVQLERDIRRSNEAHYWPAYTSRIEGRLNQTAVLKGLRGISPGRNVQLIPYGSFRSFRALDDRDELFPRFVSDRAELDGGLNAKIILLDTLVLDLTVNPDFGQVESDEPQVTANERFDVFFPEKRPFFLENANFFRTPINLVFTRSIADPKFGVRLSGKTGPYTIGALVIDDEAPGKEVLSLDPLSGKRAKVGLLRVSRDLQNQSSIGFIYTNREFLGSYNRVGGLDGRLKLNSNWVATFQGVASSTRELDGTSSAGPAFDATLQRSGRQFNYTLDYSDRSPGFNTDLGFVPRIDIRSLRNNARYRFRPEGKVLISWGPNLNWTRIWDHNETRLDWIQNPSINFDLIGQTRLSVFYVAANERLRPVDFDVLPADRDFKSNGRGFSFSSNFFRQVSVNTNWFREQAINFVPPDGEAPFLTNKLTGRLGVTLRLLTPLRIDNTYLWTRMQDRATGASIFNNHIFRSKWNWQFSNRLSLRFIAQYDTVLSNERFTSLTPGRNINGDVLLTYRVNPWTALFVGYNSNGQNFDLFDIDPVNPGAGREALRTGNRFINDSKQVFVKFSYLLRF